MYKWPCNCVFSPMLLSYVFKWCWHNGRTGYAVGSKRWAVIYYPLCADSSFSFLSFQVMSEEQARMKLKPNKRDSPGGAIDRCGAPGATDPMSGWSMDGYHQPSRVNLPLLSNSILTDANKCCSVIAEHLQSERSVPMLDFLKVTFLLQEKLPTTTVLSLENADPQSSKCMQSFQESPCILTSPSNHMTVKEESYGVSSRMLRSGRRAV